MADGARRDQYDGISPRYPLDNDPYKPPTREELIRQLAEDFPVGAPDQLSAIQSRVVKMMQMLDAIAAGLDHTKTFH